MAGASTNQIALNGATTGTDGAGTQVVSVSVPATGSLVLPAGQWMIPPITGVSVQVQSTTPGTWVTVVAAATGACGVYSDGVNTQLANSGTSAAAVLLYGPNGGTVAPNTFA